MKRFLKKCLQTAVIICFAATGEVLLSVFNADRMWAFLFFFIIGTYLCGITTLPITAAYLLCDAYMFGGNMQEAYVLILFLAFVSIAKKRLNVYWCIILSYCASAFFHMAYILCIGKGVLVWSAFESWYKYLICGVCAMPFVYALMRAGAIERHKTNKKS